MIKLKKKLLIIAISAFLLLNSVMVVNAIKVENKDEYNFEKVVFNDELKIIESYTFSKSDFENQEPVENPVTGGVPDFSITHFKAWFSGFIDDDKYVSYAYKIENIGDGCYVTGYVKIKLYYVYPDHEKCYTKASHYFNNTYIREHFLIQLFKQFTLSYSNYSCPGLRLEIETNIEESNTENNIVYEDFIDGTTFCGQVYVKDFNGNKQTAELAKITASSEFDTWDFSYCVGGDQFGSHDWYTLTAPKDPNKPAYEYEVTARISLLQKKTKITEPLEGLSYKEIDFTFGPKNRPRTIFENLFERFPILKNLFLLFS
jgi:hypothetical protein